MSKIPYLDNLGEEMRRVTVHDAGDDADARVAPGLSRAVLTLAGIAGAAALLITWLPSLTSGTAWSSASDQAVPSYGSRAPEYGPGYAPEYGEESEIEMLAISFESIRAESSRALAAKSAADAREAKGPYPRSLLDAMGPDFNVLYVPGYLPEGFSLYGQLRLGDGVDRAPRVQIQLLKYNDSCFFVIEQFARGFTPRSVEDLAASGLRPVDANGLRLYTTPSDSEHLIYFFEKDGTWFDVIGRSPQVGPVLTAEEVARMATSLQPYARSAWGDDVAVAPTVAVFAAMLTGESANVTRNRSRGC